MQSEKTIIDIAFFINDKYACHCATTMVSILRNSAEDDFHRFYIVNTDLTEDSKRKLEKLKKIKKFDISYISFDRNLIKCVPPNVGLHISEETNCRLKVASALPDLEKVICLDCDLIVLDSLKELWNTDITEYESACTLDLPYSSAEVQSKAKLDNYFNSGVMLTNLKKWREHNTEDKIFAAIKEYASILRYPDQDSLNIGINNSNMKQIDYKYNLLVLFLDCYPRAEKEESMKNPVVFHWAGARKPWNEPASIYADLYWENARETPFYEQILMQMVQFNTKHLEQVFAVAPQSQKACLLSKIDKTRCKKMAKLLVGKY